MRSFERQVWKKVCQHKLLKVQDRVIVSVSGGADSVALLHLFCLWRASLHLDLLVIHFNHGLRSEESEVDASFVETLCDQLNVPCTISRIHMKRERQKRTGQSIQSIARELRYETLTHTARENGFTKVALGHTSDDQAETVLMWMLRGAGSVGLSGMPIFRPPYFIRPLLGVSRSEVEAYLRENQWTYRVDSSNANLRYRRNSIRHQVMPILKQFNPNLVDVLSRQANIVREESEYLDSITLVALESAVQKSDDQRIVLSRRILAEIPPPIQRRVILLLYRRVSNRDVHPRFDFVENVLDHVKQGNTGWQLEAPGVRVYQDYDEVHVCVVGEEKDFVQHPVNLSVPGSIYWPLSGRTLEACMLENLPESWKDDSACAYLDANHFTHDLVVRSWKAGDSFCPLGMNGKKKKIQDFFSDLKLEQIKRRAVPIVEAPEGIVWVAGFRMDHRFRVMNGTKKFVVLKLGPQDFPSSFK